jgi:hypothetical protein
LAKFVEPTDLFRSARIVFWHGEKPAILSVEIAEKRLDDAVVGHIAHVSSTENKRDVSVRAIGVVPGRGKRRGLLR